MKCIELYDTISEYLNDEEILKLLGYEYFQNWDNYRRKDLLLMISDSEVLLNALQDEEKIKDFSNWNLEE